MMVKRYKDIHGNSGVVSWQGGPGYILLKFRDSDKIYRYSYHSAGKTHVEQMKLLAKNGRGLSAYVSQHVRDRYEGVPE